MTAEEKTTLARFLDLTSDYLGGGHTIKKTSLPLAYLVEEPGESTDSLEAVAGDVTACTACSLAASRTVPVPGEGSANPLVMVIGEGPGAGEDIAGKPFAGKAGQLLDKMLESIGLFRDRNCYITNMVKCRPPENRDPGPEEIAACLPFLNRQIALLKPRIILCAGPEAAQNLLKTGKGIDALRGGFLELEFNSGSTGDGEAALERIPVLCTFHPGAVLRDESLKRPAWEDLKLLKSRLALITDQIEH